jgi:pimeloyl-ACP methyl ester carboxylesterase
MSDPVSPNCEYTIEGNPEGPTLVFIHGWPDNASLWRHQVAALGAEHRCVLITLPNYGETSLRAGGFDFPELLGMLAAVVREVRRGDEAVTLITHDWGAYCGYLLEQAHPELFSRMVALDVGGHVSPPDLKAKLMIVGYQWALILFWLIGGLIPPLGGALTRAFARPLGVPRRQREHIRSRYNYLYFYLWRALLFSRYRAGRLSRYRPQCPVLFLWGGRKPVMFHSMKWLEIVEASGGHSRCVEGAGHWLMESHADEVNRVIRDWLSRGVVQPGSMPSAAS